MTRHTRNRQTIWVAVALAVTLILGSCGAEDEQAIEAAALEPESSPEVETESADAATATTAAPEPSSTVDADTDDVLGATDIAAVGQPISGDATLRLNPLCSVGPPLSAEPGDCETFGGYTLLRAQLSGERTGTFEGTESLYATFAVDGDGSYVYGGISSFVGTVAECGQGAVVFNTAGWGNFDLEASAEVGSPVMGATEAISYTATASKLPTLDVVVDAEMVTTDSGTFEVGGTVACGTDPQGPAGAVRPDSGVSEADARDWTGPATFAMGSNCSLSSTAAPDEACAVVDGFTIMPLLNSLEFSGTFEGDARFIGTNLLVDSEWEHSGILVFEGTVEGCGQGSVVMVNEATGNAYDPAFPHQRAFTPPQFGLGSIGVHVDGKANPRGVVSSDLSGSYSCAGPTDGAPADAEGDPSAGSSAAFDAVDDYVVETVLANPDVDGAGLIVVDADGVLHHQSYGTFALDRVSPIASSSKMISAGVLLRLAEEGALDIDAPLVDITDSAADHPDLTVAQLLSNSSGLVNDGAYAPYFCQIVGDNLRECSETILATPDDDNEIIAPDTEFRYGGAQWQVAGGIAEIASGESWAELIDRIYVEPCGLDSLAYASGAAVFADFPAPPTWFDGDPASIPETDNPNIEGGGFINTADYGVLLQMQLNGGQCPGGQVLSQPSLDIMHADRIGAVYGGITPELGGGYGLGWWHYGGSEVGDPGAFGSRAWINTDAGYAAYWVIEDSFLTSLVYEADLRSLVHEAVTGEILDLG